MTACLAHMIYCLLAFRLFYLIDMVLCQFVSVNFKKKALTFPRWSSPNIKPTKMRELHDPEDMIDHSQSESSDSDTEEENGGSTSGTSTSFAGGDQSSESEDARRMEIIEREEKRVRKARFVLVATIIVCASIVTTAVYVSFKNNEHNVFVKKVCFSCSFLPLFTC
jgi:hypothetical protein